MTPLLPLNALSFCFPQALEVLAKATTQRQEEEGAPKDRSGVVKETAPAAEEPKMQLEEEEPPTPEDNRAPVPLGPSGLSQVMSQELIWGLAEATSNVAFGQMLLGQGSTAGPRGASRSTGPPLPLPPSLNKGKGKGKGKGTRVSPYPPGVAGLLPHNNLWLLLHRALHCPGLGDSPQNCV